MIKTLMLVAEICRVSGYLHYDLESHQLHCQKQIIKCLKQASYEERNLSSINLENGKVLADCIINR